MQKSQMEELEAALVIQQSEIPNCSANVAKISASPKVPKNKFANEKKITDERHANTSNQINRKFVKYHHHFEAIEEITDNLPHPMCLSTIALI